MSVALRVAVTGAGGLLGRDTSLALETAGHEVLRLSTSLPSSAAPRVLRSDLQGDWRTLVAHLRDFDTIVHTAAYLPRHLDDPSEAYSCIAANAIGTLNLLRAADSASVRRFIYVSGANTLAPRDGVIQDDSPPGCEAAPFYLGSKLLGEVFVRGNTWKHSSRLVIRPTTIYGVNQRSGVIANFIARLRSRSSVEVTHGGAHCADFLLRDDLVTLLCQACSSHHQGGVNVGSGATTSILELAYLLCDLMQLPRSLVSVSPIGEQRLDSGFPSVDLTRAREWFRFSPTPLRLGLAKCLGLPGI